MYAWRGPDFIEEPETDHAGVDWILAEDWWPYQRPTFITPPFAGYLSGHSTFSRAAAEVMTLLTGDPYFPGGLGEFHAPKDEFLVFEDGPSVDVTLQWATYRDASDQCSLSRIWGGIHPPADDIPGRLIGEKIGIDAFLLAERYFMGQITSVEQAPSARTTPAAMVYPNPISRGKLLTVHLNQPATEVIIKLYNILGQMVQSRTVRTTRAGQAITLNTHAMASGLYLLRIIGNTWESSHRVLILK